jgi:hypothetical protein
MGLSHTLLCSVQSHVLVRTCMSVWNTYCCDVLTSREETLDECWFVGSGLLRLFDELSLRCPLYPSIRVLSVRLYTWDGFVWQSYWPAVDGRRNSITIGSNEVLLLSLSLFYGRKCWTNPDIYMSFENVETEGWWICVCDLPSVNNLAVDN